MSYLSDNGFFDHKTLCCLDTPHIKFLSGLTLMDFNKFLFFRECSVEDFDVWVTEVKDRVWNDQARRVQSRNVTRKLKYYHPKSIMGPQAPFTEGNMAEAYLLHSEQTILLVRTEPMMFFLNELWTSTCRVKPHHNPGVMNHNFHLVHNGLRERLAEEGRIFH